MQHCVNNFLITRIVASITGFALSSCAAPSVHDCNLDLVKHVKEKAKLLHVQTWDVVELIIEYSSTEHSRHLSKNTATCSVWIGKLIWGWGYKAIAREDASMYCTNEWWLVQTSLLSYIILYVWAKGVTQSRSCDCRMPELQNFRS